MTLDLEHELRRVFGDDRRALPVRPDAVHLVGARVVRRRRRRVAATVTSGLAVLALLAGVVTAVSDPPQRSQPADSVIPWVDGPPVAPPDLARRSPRPDQPACVTSSGSAWVQDGLAFADGLTGTVLFDPITDHRCTLSGIPRLVATDDRTGQRRTLPSLDGKQIDDEAKQYPATIDPGEPARVDVTLSDSCPEPTDPIRYEDLAIVVGGHEYRLDGPVLMTGCPVRIGYWYVQPPLLNSPLTVTLDAPPQAHRGQWYEYTVIVLNAYPRPFRLDPCPVYTQRLSGTPGSGGYRQLPCPVDEIAPHTSLRYTMRVLVDPDAQPGPVDLHWMAVMANGTVAIANLATDGTTVEIVG